MIVSSLLAASLTFAACVEHRIQVYGVGRTRYAVTAACRYCEALENNTSKAVRHGK
jgi:hypothetical protein